MNLRFVLAGIAGFLISNFGGFIFHGLLLHADYLKLGPIMRTDEDAMNYLPFMLLSHLIKGFAFAWVYSKGITAGSPAIMQGLKFGVATVFLVTIPLYLVYYSVEPLPGMLVVKQMVVDGITMIAMGVVTALIIKPTEAK